MLGHYMRKKRIDRELTGAIVAIRCHVSRQAVSLWENGETTPTVENLDRWSSALSLSVAERITASELRRDR